MTAVMIIIAIGCLILAIFSAMERAEWPEEKKLEFEHGPKSDKIICPQCQTAGNVYTKPCQQKAGISGAKAAGAVLTGGLSVLATGLSRKVATTEAYCHNCKSTWHF